MSAGVMALMTIALLLGLLAVFGLVIPIYSLIQCAKSDTLTQKDKVRWMLGFVLFFAFAGWTYAIKHPVSKLHRIAGMISWGLGLTLGGGLIYSMISAHKETDKTLLQFQHPDHVKFDSNVPNDLKQKLMDSFHTLRNEYTLREKLDWDSRDRFHAFALYMNAMMANGMISTEEANDWFIYFDERKYISDSSVRKKAMSLTDKSN